jgi:tetratricopeptide (TPR) repeat protein
MIHYLLPYETALAESWRYVFPVMLLAIGTLWLLWRNHPVGYLGTWMFSILSATSLIPIITETAAERRMYLPIAALSALFVVGGYSILRRVLRERTAGSRGGVNRRPALIMAFAVTLLAVCYGVVSANRVGTYLDPFELWQQVVKAQPENHIARENMGHQFEETGDIPGAIKEYREAIRLQPGFAMAHNSLGFLFIHAKAYPEAIVELREAVRNDPRRVLMRSNLAAALFASGKVEPALAELRTALELEPENWIIHKNMAYALQVAGRHPESIEYYQRALALNSKDVSMYGSIAQSLVQLKRREQAIATLKQGIALAQGAGDIANAEMLSAQLNKIR